ncbi:hypothetical protein HPB52_022216 [Rhipicephalus sanguineus]|uniref:Uncharacterized protein n=1 Tax=Rhipicephalus sanguineus TaxID=34632 RepID=A0A9D4PN27_RHISA|nr:hypothetical protein HPB52_022216 [Rhipicephalus sanguineus]
MNAETDVTAQRKSPRGSCTSSPSPRKSSSPKKQREPSGQQGPLDERPKAERSASESPADGDSSHAHRRSDSIGSSLLAHMHSLAFQCEDDQHHASASTWRSTAAAFRSWARSMAPLFVALLAAFVLVAFFVGSSIARKVHPEALQASGCTDCIEHMARLYNELNTSIDPCWDPVAYVCGNVRWDSDLVSDALTDMLTRWYHHGAAFLEQRRKSPVSALYQACMSRGSDTDKRPREILEFLRGRGLPWPRRSIDFGFDKDALDVILDLLINWGVSSIMEYSLCMSYNHITLRRASWFNYSKVEGRRLKYVQTMYHLYGAGDTPLAQMRDLVADEERFLRIAFHALASANRVVMKLRMVHLDLLTPNVSSDRWLEYLNKHLRPHRLLPNDNLLVVDKVVTTTTNALFERFSNADLLEQVAWGFIDKYSFANSYAAAVATYGDEEAVARFNPGMCYMLTENRYRKRLFFERSAALGGSLFMGNVSAIFEDLRNTTQRLISGAATWIDPQARNEAAAIVSLTHFEPFRSANNTSLETLPRQFHSPFDGWMKAAELHRRTFPGWPLNDSMLHRHGMYSFPVEYEYWWNTLYVNPAMAAAPFFYIGAPPSVNYGGFGASVAGQLIGSFLDSKRSVRSWMSRKTRKVFEDKVSCANGRYSVLMNVAAAQIAYRAFREQYADEPSRYVVGKNVSLTPDMLFFVTLCRTMCGVGEMCSRVLRNMAAFGRAFSCKPHAPMNPSRKCSFFEQA